MVIFSTKLYRDHIESYLSGFSYSEMVRGRFEKNGIFSCGPLTFAVAVAISISVTVAMSVAFANAIVVAIALSSSDPVLIAIFLSSLYVAPTC